MPLLRRAIQRLRNRRPRGARQSGQTSHMPRPHQCSGPNRNLPFPSNAISQPERLIVASSQPLFPMQRHGNQGCSTNFQLSGEWVAAPQPGSPTCGQQAISAVLKGIYLTVQFWRRPQPEPRPHVFASAPFSHQHRTFPGPQIWPGRTANITRHRPIRLRDEPMSAPDAVARRKHAVPIFH